MLTNFGVIASSGGRAVDPGALDPPVTADIFSKSAAAYGFDRLVYGYTGDTVRLKRLSDNAEEDFGFDSDGMFDLAAVNTWRSGANVDVVHHKDQLGSAVTLNAVNQITFIVSDVCERFATIWGDYTVSATKTSGSAVLTVASTTLMGVGMLVEGVGIPAESVIVSVDSGTQITISQNTTVSETSNIVIQNGLLTRDNTQGGVSGNLGVNRGYYSSSAPLTLDATSGLEIHLLFSPNKRKIAPNASTVYGGSTSNEYLFGYGFSTNAYIRNLISSVTAVNSTRVKSSSADTSTTTETGGFALKQYSQHACSYVVNTSGIGIYSTAGQETFDVLSGTTDLSGGGLSNGYLHVGTDFTGTVGAVRTTSTADICFGGVIVTEPLTDVERWFLLAKLNAVGQQHNVLTVDELKAMFDDIVLHKDIDPATGVVEGLNGTAKFEFNLPTIAAPVGTPTFEADYTVTGIGFPSLYNTDNPDNIFESTDAVPPDLNGTFYSLNMSVGTGNNLPFDIVVTSDPKTDGGTLLANNSFWSGRDHAGPAVYARPADNRQGATKVIGSRFYADRTTQFGAAVYDGANQPQGKYNRGTVNVTFTYGETIGGQVRTAASWMNQGANSLGLDGNVISHLPDNIRNISKDGRMMLQCSRFEAPAEYVKSDDWATRLPHTLKSDNWSIVQQAVPMGHRDGDVAHNPYGGVVDNDTGARFKSFDGILTGWQGHRFAWMWTSQVHTNEQVQQVGVSYYRLFQ